MDREYAYNRALFRRVEHGWYQFNPVLEVRGRTGSGEEVWRPIFAALNLPLVAEFSTPYARPYIGALLASAGIPAPPVPMMAEREHARSEEEARRRREELRALDALRLERQREAAALLAERGRRQAPRVERSSSVGKPRWGTKEARRDAMLELQRKIDESRQRGEKKDQE